MGVFPGKGQAFFEAAQSAAANVARSRATPPPTFKVLSGIGDAAFQTGGGPGAVVEYRGSMLVVGIYVTFTDLATPTPYASTQLLATMAAART